jgi:hypothetical protein
MSLSGLLGLLGLLSIIKECDYLDRLFYFRSLVSKAFYCLCACVPLIKS